MQPRFRLHRTSDIQRVRRIGKSYAHPLLVLIAAKGVPPARRVAVSAGKRVGGAVQRNRAKRRLREAVRPLLESLSAGWDLLLVARSGAVTADYADLAGAVRLLFQKAGVLDDHDEHPARAGG